ncbi:hypothetical protein VNO80_15638 [Phaseolus coccineus]|uniref:Secreted protein n=1 Tax=Phaseolus coccineus TaxID=3886 RepID=A0AAN9MQ95_PHACN
MWKVSLHLFSLSSLSLMAFISRHFFTNNIFSPGHSISASKPSPPFLPKRLRQHRVLHPCHPLNTLPTSVFPHFSSNSIIPQLGLMLNLWIRILGVSHLGWRKLGGDLH